MDVVWTHVESIEGNYETWYAWGKHIGCPDISELYVDYDRKDGQWTYSIYYLSHTGKPEITDAPITAATLEEAQAVALTIARMN